LARVIVAPAYSLNIIMPGGLTLGFVVHSVYFLAKFCENCIFLLQTTRSVISIML